MSKLIQTKDDILKFVLELQYVSQLVERETQRSRSERNDTGPALPAVPVLNQL